MNTALTFFRPDAVKEILPLYRVVQTQVDVRKDEFHNISGSYSPSKAVCDRISDAAGISFINEKCGVRIEDLSEPYYGYASLKYIGFAQAEVTEPDGKKRKSSVCEYEFDVMVRSEEEFLRDEERSPKDRRYASEIARKKFILGLIKVARQRANTGARLRVIHELTGMPTGFKDLFSKADPNGKTVKMTFSKVVANPENKLVLQEGLRHMFGNAQSVYGNNRIPQNTSRIVTPSITDVTEEEQKAFSEPEDDFSEVPWEEPEESVLTRGLKNYLEDSRLPQDALRMIEDMLTKNDATETELAELTERIEKYIKRLDAKKERRIS